MLLFLRGRHDRRQEIREAADLNQKAFLGTMEAVRSAQSMITALQIEAQPRSYIIYSLQGRYSVSE